MVFYRTRYILIIALLLLTAGCMGPPGADLQTGRDQPEPAMRVSVSSGVNGSDLPAIYSCTGPGQVPAIFWRDPPTGAQSMAVIMEDPDAPSGLFTHWIVYNLDPAEGGVPPNQLPVAERAGSGFQGLNSLKTRGYLPPCPPDATVHRYVFTLYALDTRISPSIPDRSQIDAAMEGHILETASIVNFFGRE